MKTLKTIGVIILFLSVIVSCNKKEETQTEVTTNSNNTTFSFISLTTDKTEIKLGDEAIITANVTGDNLTYTWSVNTSSTIIGSGSRVRLYASCPSCTGPNEVTCTVKDANNISISKSITITVIP